MGSEAGMPWKALQGLEDLKVGVGDRRNLLEEGLQYLTSLRNLGIKMLVGEGEMEGVELPIKALLNLHSLESLEIVDCKDLILSWKPLLSMKLEKLTLMGVERVIDVEDGTMMVVEQQSLLRGLKIDIMEGAKWVDDMPWISLSSSLQDLYIWRMRGREQLPDGIQHLASLQTLEIKGCEKLRSLPVWMPKLTSLRNLRIRGCSEELERRCERGTGEDWPLICHVTTTYISVKWEMETIISEAIWKEEEEGSRKKGGYGCTPCWTTHVKE